LEKESFETLCIDLKGLGENKAGTGDCEKKSLAKEALALISIRRPQVRSFAVIGHDWGGSIAIAMAALSPKRVSKIIVEDEIPPGISAPLRGKSLTHYSSWHGAFHRVAHLPERLIAGNEDPYLNYFLNLRFDPKSLRAADRKYYISCYRGLKKTRSSLAYYRCSHADSRFFAALTRNKIKTPALAIYGDCGMGSAVVDSLSLFCQRPSSAGITNCGHYPAEERPLVFNKIVRTFLGRSRHD
jgi:pimeloyl-ACP methyl ester carboxylesterase